MKWKMDLEKLTSNQKEINNINKNKINSGI
jgi:hypothetical protein